MSLKFKQKGGKRIRVNHAHLKAHIYKCTHSKQLNNDALYLYICPPDNDPLYLPIYVSLILQPRNIRERSSTFEAKGARSTRPLFYAT